MRYVGRTLSSLAVAAVALAGCGGGNDASGRGAETGAAAGADSAAAPAASNELSISNVMIGKRIGAGNRVTEPTFQFAPSDTVYVAVATEGTPASATLAAVWHFQTGQLVDSASQTIQPQGAEATEFHVSRPKGWPVGTYKVTVYADGDSVDTKTFAVKK
ncbi:MAG: hypothetical protein H0T90_04835 [Gemmatimonadales bacterium]|nr:hypothetical protein [Gemmatimonadales bacterium]